MSSVEALKWVLGARSETGYVRTANEDRMGWTRTSYGNVYVVSDGMGGYRGGALAAEITVRTLRERLAALSADDLAFEEQVRAAFGAANDAVHGQRNADDPETRDMGATAVALVTTQARVLVGHVGDSRAYLWRRGDGLKRLTRDHTRMQKMLDAGLITPAQAVTHPDASVLDRAIGHRPQVEPDVGAWIALVPGDMVLLCSDGLCGYVGDDEIDRVLRAKGDPQVLADKLIDCALLKGGEDNVTVQLVLFCGAAGGAMAQNLARPLVLLPLCAALSAAIAWAVATQATAPLEQRLASVQGRVEVLEKIPPPPAPVMPPAPSAAPAGAPASAASAAVPAASLPASAAASSDSKARPAAKAQTSAKTQPKVQSPAERPKRVSTPPPVPRPAAPTGIQGQGDQPSRSGEATTERATVPPDQ